MISASPVELSTGYRDSDVDSSPRRRSPVAVALADHAALCPRCTHVSRANLPWRMLCAAGRILAECAIKARAPRRSR
jgi:hypothetical protein